MGIGGMALLSIAHVRVTLDDIAGQLRNVSNTIAREQE